MPPSGTPPGQVSMYTPRMPERHAVIDCFHIPVLAYCKLCHCSHLFQRNKKGPYCEKRSMVLHILSTVFCDPLANIENVSSLPQKQSIAKGSRNDSPLHQLICNPLQLIKRLQRIKICTDRLAGEESLLCWIVIYPLGYLP